jgi:O-antigen biosynthesis protein
MTTSKSPAPGWLEELVAQALRPEIAVVGPKLLFPNGHIQHAGVILVPDGAVHIDRGAPGTASGHGQRLRVVQSVSALTGAAMFVRRAVFEAIGRFDPMFPVNFNDTDFCLRARQAGYRCLFTPHVELIHHESATRKISESIHRAARMDYDKAMFLSRWGCEVYGDEYHNPNLI